MKTILFTVLMYWSVVGADKCVHFRDWHIKEALYYNQQLILITFNEEIYAVKGFKFGIKVEFESIEKIQLFNRAFLRELAFIFTYRKDVFVIKEARMEGVPILVAKKLTFDENMTKVLNQSADIDINPYSAVPTKDPLNLMSLFAKFPEENLKDHMKAIISFPFNEWELPNFDSRIPNLPNRFFVYYSEYPTKKAKENKLTKIVNKRHIMINTTSNFKYYTEVNWKRDSKSGSCFEEKTDISAATRLREGYSLFEQKSKDSYLFEIMEFYGSEYSIKLVEVNKEDVSKDFVSSKNGSLIDLFSCVVEKLPDPTDSDIEPDREPDIGPDDEEPGITEDVFRLLLYILISVFLIGIFILIFVAIFIVWKRKQRRHQHSDHHRSESKATGHRSDVDKDVNKVTSVEPVVEPKNSSKV